ncbi:MAG: WG repeat-containing protein [Deltaproteobacteria bacterium]|jgi:hypothetical protein|nr:WG repeat-containing protein [Deltaproteobacteria bacterium]
MLTNNISPVLTVLIVLIKLIIVDIHILAAQETSQNFKTANFITSGYMVANDEYPLLNNMDYIRVKFKWGKISGMDTNKNMNFEAIIDGNGNFIIKPHANLGKFSYFNNQLVIAASVLEVKDSILTYNQRRGVLNTKSQWVIKPSYEVLEIVEAANAILAADPATNMMGVIDHNEKWSIYPKYQFLVYIGSTTNNSYFRFVQKDDTVGVVDLSGRLILGPINVKISNIIFLHDISNDKIQYFILKEGVMNTKDRLFSTRDGWIINDKDNLSLIDNNGIFRSCTYTQLLCDYYDIKGNPLDPYKVAINDNHTLYANTIEKAGYADSKGDAILKFIYDMEPITEFKSNNYHDILYKVKFSGKFGLVNAKENWVIEPKYDQIEQFPGNKDYIYVRSKDKIGVLNLNNDLIVPVEFDSVEQINESIWVIAKNGKFGFLKDGKEMYFTNTSLYIKSIKLNSPHIITLTTQTNEIFIIDIAEGRTKVIFSVEYDQNGMALAKDGTRKVIWPLGKEYDLVMSRLRHDMVLAQEIKQKQEEEARIKREKEAEEARIKRHKELKEARLKRQKEAAEERRKRQREAEEEKRKKEILAAENKRQQNLEAERKRQQNQQNELSSADFITSVLGWYIKGVARGFKEMVNPNTPGVLVGDRVSVCSNIGSCPGKIIAERSGEYKVRFDSNKCAPVNSFDEYLSSTPVEAWVRAGAVKLINDRSFTCPH